jgi:filamentous hemagglutinin
VDWLSTRVSADNRLTVESGGDTTLKGAVLSGKQVMADVGGHLTIESLQARHAERSRDQSLSGSITVGIGAAGSFNVSQQKIDSDWASVTRLSGIQAGDEGFQVDVKGHTALKGAVIASTQQAVRGAVNRLTTGTLSTEDMVNRAAYEAGSMSLGGCL